jgi:hypothetical protein
MPDFDMRATMQRTAEFLDRVQALTPQEITQQLVQCGRYQIFQDSSAVDDEYLMILQEEAVVRMGSDEVLRKIEHLIQDGEEQYRPQVEVLGNIAVLLSMHRAGEA